MPDTAPDWLAKALGKDAEKLGPGHAKLVAASLGSAEIIGKGGLAISSAAFRDRGELDPCFTADEEDAVAPPVEWTSPPPGTQELVLIVEDADFQTGEPFCHWLVWGLPAQKGQILEGEAPPRVGKNAFGNSEWLLPDPPTGDKPHDYVFQLFALDLPLTLMPGASREELVAAMEGHVTALALITATYAREEGGDYDWDDSDDDN
ncbi:YbhB/YbcL family Raf kinase inhibitor-like protein [Aurantiacibacter aquimixticola]|uniref:YbhB/YbcL family Raf kinase inhibitor-like protein n=1 Tax=Aurantiacibacter aquimixticola TaxID=1958945 RepID=A0A419RW10_9SPHN|nr:YbhB/YbcL family Raf kinase inhibitor-like protein [Aurantiacibacter aquimixticola]RJY09954.1 YbhB/YbcL family Raf kinase inhibitor-like protein [Aurantiacibacter aquimixticola]